MLYLILSIIGSVSVGVLFKYIKKLPIHILQMVIINYVTTMSLSYFIFDVNLSQLPVNLPLETILPLGFLLPAVFLFQYFSVVYSGIIKTDIAQRMSLFIPVLAAIFIFQEKLSPLRYVALFIGLIAIYFIVNKPAVEYKNQTQKTTLYPVLVFIGFGVIDVFFKQLALYSEIPYTSSLFYVFAFAFALISVYYVINHLALKKEVFTFTKETLFCGVLLGALNFINILFYMKAHQTFSSNPITVFAGMNFGVITLGTIIGYFGFKEAISRKNILGLALGCIAISLLLYTQY